MSLILAYAFTHSRVSSVSWRSAEMQARTSLASSPRSHQKPCGLSRRKTCSSAPTSKCLLISYVVQVNFHFWIGFRTPGASGLWYGGIGMSRGFPISSVPRIL